MTEVTELWFASRTQPLASLANFGTAEADFVHAILFHARDTSRTNHVGVRRSVRVAVLDTSRGPNATFQNDRHREVRRSRNATSRGQVRQIMAASVR